MTQTRALRSLRAWEQLERLQAAALPHADRPAAVLEQVHRHALGE